MPGVPTGKALKKGQRPRRVGFFRYRKRGRHMAFTPTNGRNTIRVDGNRVRIPAIGRVRMTEPLRFAGDILSATVSLEADRWFIAFQVDTGEPAPPKRPGPTVGIDMGLQVLATLWDGDERPQIVNPRPLQEALAELRCIDQAISRSLKVHGRHRTSHRREALYARRQRQYARVSHLRNDHHHQTTTAIAKRGGTVKGETLPIAGMQRNRRRGRALGDAGLGGFVRQLAYKCAWYGTAFQRSARWYPSLEDLQCVRGREAVAAAIGAHVPLSALRLRVRPGRERRPQPPGVRHGSQVGRHQRGDP